MLKFWFVLFLIPHDGHAGIGAPQIVMGPFPTVETCSGAAALGIDKLNNNDAKDFRGACVNDADILPLQELAARAGAPR